MRLHASWVAPVGYALILAACGGGTDPGADTALTVVSGAGVQDTAAARLALPLVVELATSDGSPVAHRPITFIGAGCPGSCSALLIPVSAPGSAGSEALVDTTDASGRAQVLVRLGTVTGPSVVRIISAGTGDSASAAYTTLPASPHTLTVSPADTGLYSQASYQLQINATDQFGNAVGTAPVITALNPAVATVSPTGQVTAQAAGRTSVSVVAGALHFMASISVLPQMQIAINQGGTVISLVELDGSVVHSTGASANLEALDVVPGQQQVVFSQFDGAGDGRVYHTDFLGSPTRITQTDTLNTLECYPVVSADATTVYFSAFDKTGQLAAYRVNLDGSGLMRLAADSGAYQPAISPDNDHVAYVATRDPHGCGMAVLTLSTGNNACLNHYGQMPRWSPDGTRIAYLGGLNQTDVYVMNADGSGATLLSTPGLTLYIEGGPIWSNDGAWLLALTVGGRINAIRVSDGLTVPVPWTHQVVWIAVAR